MKLTKADKGSKTSAMAMSDVLGRDSLGEMLPVLYTSYPLCDTNLLFNLNESSVLNFKCADYKDGLVALTLTLPPELLKDFVQLLTTLQDFIRFLSNKGKAKKAEADFNAPAELAKRQKRVDGFKADVARPFRLLTRHLNKAARPLPITTA